MVSFLTIGCETEEVNFFTSGAYTRPSFSTKWDTRFAPDTEGLSPVYLMVLDKFGVSVDSSGGLPSRGLLPGIDIKRMDAIQAIRFSMAESILDKQWWEIYEDVFGGVYFQNVFNNGSPGKTVDLDVRLCIPSANKNNEVDMVIVHGYDPPPQRYVKGFRDVVPVGPGPVNPANVTGNEDVFTVDAAALVRTCHSTQLKHEAIKSYRDPVFTDALGPQETNPFYDVKAYESLIAWVVDVDGMPEGAGDAARVKYEFSPYTTWYYRPEFPKFSKVTDFDTIFGEDGCDAVGLQTGTGITYYKGVINYTSPNYSDKYGYSWPLVLKPAQILYTGYKVERITQIGDNNYVFVAPIPEFMRLGEGSQWVYTVKDVNTYEITMYYQPKVDPVLWDVILDILGGGEGDVTLKLSDGTDTWLTSIDTVPQFSGATLGILPGPNSLGLYVTDLWLALNLDRPSVKVTDAGGDARAFSDALRIQYAPIIGYDPPAPIAYKHKDVGVVEISADLQGQFLQDADPTTCQNLEETPVQIMQDLMEGNVVEASFPFCATVSDCAAAASTIFDYQNYAGVVTYTLTCGPDDEPELGAAVVGFDTNLRIESINYSYQDGSAYTIEVSLGPVFANVGSWNAGAWIKKTESVSRKAIIIWTAGDGTNYRVNIQGLGEYNAINSVRDIWRIGEHVMVTVYNVPVEE